MNESISQPEISLAEIIPLDGVRAIEASAGTGKTYTLAGLYVRLLIERHLQVRQILVVTYTRAAADELTLRLRERLRVCLDVFERRAMSDDRNCSAERLFCARLIDAALARGETSANLRRRLRLAELSLDEAQISTVHAFCQRALGDFAWAAAVEPPHGSLLENERALSDSIAADLWRAQSNGVDAVAWSALIRIAPSAQALARLLWELRDQRTRLQPEISFPEDQLRERIDAAESARIHLADRWRKECDAACERLLAQRAAKLFNGVKLVLASVHKHRKILSREAADGALESVESLRYFAPSVLSSKWSSKTAAFQADPLFVAAETALATIDAGQAALVQLGLIELHRCAAALHERVERGKRELRSFSYDDLVLRVHDAVTAPGNASISASIADKYPAALIDECQDSDARQFEIFFAIYRARGLLCIIGDPKQAIYRFRGGDVHAYLKARAEADSSYRLEQNFRSTPALVRAVNSLYTHAGIGAFANPQIEFEPVTAAGKARDDDLMIDHSSVPALTFWTLPEPAAGTRVPSKEISRVQLANGCAGFIQNLLSLARSGRAQLRQRADVGESRHAELTAKNLAVLVNDHHEAAAMQRALSAGGVASVVITRASVFSSEEARDIHALFVALDSFDESRLRALLLTSLLGWSLQQAAQLLANAAAWRDQLHVFSQWRALWRERGVLALLEQVAGQRTAALLKHADGERRLTNVMHIADLAQRAAREVDGERALCDWLARRIGSARDDREEEQLRLESDANRVQIVTLHKSKGLEYPIVFLPFASLQRVASRRAGFARFRDGDQEIVHVFTGDARDDRARELEAREANAEKLRLLYVGLTRAQVACFVGFGTIGTSSEPSALRQVLMGGQSDQGPIALESDFEKLALQSHGAIAVAALPQASTHRMPAIVSTKTVVPRVAMRRVREPRDSHSFSRLSASARAQERHGDDDETLGSDEFASAVPSDIPAALRGANFGSAFHEIIEHVDFSAWRNWRGVHPPPSEAALIDRLLRRYALLTERGGDMAAITAITRLLAATLNAQLPLGTTLAQLARFEYRAEMPFHLSLAGVDTLHWLRTMQAAGYVSRRTQFEPQQLAGMMTGILDLVVCHRNRYWVIDYKTNVLGNTSADYAPARLIDAVRDGEYDLQYLIYLTALHRWLKSRLGNQYDYERDVGGALYLFVRGLDAHGVNGIHHAQPRAALIEAIDDLLAPIAVGVA